MTVEEFNALDEAAALDVVAAWAAVPAWARAVVAGRPYADVEQVAALAEELAADWGQREVDAALADHPRIGERHPGSGAGAAMSRSEQAAVAADAADVDVQARLATGNRRYEEVFGRIFLVRAAGRSAEEILARLEERLGNDPSTELRVTAGQLREIAVLRLRGALGEVA